MKKILLLNDLCISSKAASSINVFIFNHFNYEVDLLPTYLYSNHLGFKDIVSLDTASFLKDTLNLFKQRKQKYDFIYAGLLVNEANINVLLDYLDNQKLYLDPILGDNGSFYKTITKEYAIKVRELAKKAYLITPNLFEAYALLDKQYETNISIDKIFKLAQELVNLGPKIVVITSVKVGLEYGVYLYSKELNISYFSKITMVDYFPHGTGDMFSTLFISLIEENVSLTKSLDMTVNIIKDIIINNKENNIDLLYGLSYEKLLAKKIDLIKVALG